MNRVWAKYFLDIHNYFAVASSSVSWSLVSSAECLEQGPKIQIKPQNTHVVVLKKYFSCSFLNPLSHLSFLFNSSSVSELLCSKVFSRTLY